MSSADPLSGPFDHFSVLCFVSAIVLADPGPPTAGAFKKVNLRTDRGRVDSRESIIILGCDSFVKLVKIIADFVPPLCAKS